MNRLITKRRIITGTLILILITIILILAIKNKSTSVDGSMRVEKNVVTWNQEMESTDKNASIQIPYYSDIYMKDGSDKIDMYLVNPKENNCYFKYTFVLKDDGDVIYESNLLESGKAIDSVKLNKKLKTGEYVLEIKIDTYTTSNKEPLNNALVETKLLVQ